MKMKTEWRTIDVIRSRAMRLRMGCEIESLELATLYAQDVLYLIGLLEERASRAGIRVSKATIGKK